MIRDFPTERVECGKCDGCGVVEFSDDLFGFFDSSRCLECAGTGWVDVCANCYDDWNGCTVCNPSDRAPAVAPTSAPAGGDPGTGETPR